MNQTSAARGAETLFSDPLPYLDTASLSSQISFRLRFAQAAVWGDLLAAFKPFGFRPQHYTALTLIASNPDWKQQDIGNALGISRSNLVALIDELVREGLVDRRQNPDNRRSNSLSISPSGTDLLERMDVAQRAHERRLEQTLDGKEQAMLIALLEKLTQLQR